MIFMEAVENYPDTLTVIDVEASCWKEKDPKNINEIIEIGAAQVNNKKILKLDPIIVQPKFSKISEFCTHLTQITQAMVDKGELPEIAFPKMEKLFIGNTWASWGDYDRKMILRMADLYKMSITIPPNHINIREMFGLIVLKVNDPYAAPSNPKDALEQLGETFQGQNHRGGDDAYNIARLYILLKDYNR